MTLLEYADITTGIRRTTSDNSYWYSGTDASPYAQLHRKQISALRDMLGKFAEVAAEDGITVSRQSVLSAGAFLSGLPFNRALPEVAVDAEGDVVLSWQCRKRCEATIAGAQIFFIENPGSQSSHYGPFTFYGGVIPSQVLQRIPIK